jgi:hypothetical protein
MIIRKVQRKSWGSYLTTIPKEAIRIFGPQCDLWCLWEYDRKRELWTVRIVNDDIVRTR